MNFFFDSSSLLKRYLNEVGDDKVQKLFEQADKIFISIITHVECASAFKRLLHTKFINEKEYQLLHSEINLDLPFFETIYFDDDTKINALKIIEKYPMKALDTIQLASLIQVSNEIDYFIVCDQKLKKYALKEGIHIIDPTE